jgi:hypothetical protein
MRKLTSSLTSPTDPHHETPAMTYSGFWTGEGHLNSGSH